MKPATTTTVQRTLVLGGGVSGQRAALDVARAGVEVVLVESAVTLGGTVAQLGSMYPLHSCLLCRGDAVHGPGCTRPAISAELLSREGPQRIDIRTRTRLVELSGEPGHFRATLAREPRFVDAQRCIGCDRCAEVCPKEMPDQFQAGLATRKAAYRPADRSVPDAYAIDKGPWCDNCGACVTACPTSAINLSESATTETVEVGAVVVATGVSLSNAGGHSEYGYGRYANVFTGLELERMAAADGPGEGQIIRRSDGNPPDRIAWIQCVGSRDEDHDYCSAFCCGYATRQAVLARRLLPETDTRIYMMDDRVFGRGFSQRYDSLRAEHQIGLERVRLSVITEDPQTRDLVLQVTDADGHVAEERFGMVVLSVGADATPEAATLAELLGIEPDGFGFLQTGQMDPSATTRGGIFVAGAAGGPSDVADSVASAGAAAARVVSFLGVTAPEPPTPPEAETPHAPQKRIGIFSCHCAGDVGDVIDLEEVTAAASQIPDVVTAAKVPFGCLPEGISEIRAAIAKHELTGVVLGACSARTFAPFFARQLGTEVELVALKDECAQVHRADPDGATRKARELIRIGALKARASRPWSQQDLGRPPARALVAGGGLAGLTAALHLADAGIEIELVEREAALGGHAMVLGSSPEGADVAAATVALAERASAHPRISVHLQSTVARHRSLSGAFTASIVSHGPAPENHSVEVGATVVAVGGAEYRGPAYGLGRSDRVLTLLDLPAENGPDVAAEAIVFIGCVGPWDEPNCQTAWRCSRGCCETMIRRARQLKERSPEKRVTVLVREVNTYGFREQEYTAARRAGVLFIRFNPNEPPVLNAEDDAVSIRVKDMAMGEELEIRAGLVVLAAATLPRAEGQDTAAALGLVVDDDGFVHEWEPKTRSVGTLEPGVFVCGLAAGPKPSREVVAQALAAAQAALIHLLDGRVVNTSESAAIDSKKCASCLTCVRICPYGVPRLGDHVSSSATPSTKPAIDAYRCQGCAMCVGECPAGAIAVERQDNERRAGILGRWFAAVPAEGAAQS